MKSNRLVTCLPILLLGCFIPAPSHAAAGAVNASRVFFVAPNGNDEWSGQRASANWGKTDGPFATVGKALAAARAARTQAGDPSASVSVVLRGGTWFLAEPLKLGPEDSGLVFAAYREEQPVLSGGRPIRQWRSVTVDGRELWAADLPEVKEGKWYFRELWVNGRRAVRARHPNRGYLKLDHLVDAASSWTEGHLRFRYHPGDLSAWKTVTEAEIIVMNRWVESRLPVFIVDEKENLVCLDKRSVFALEPGDPYFLEGAFEVLDQPGEWYLDRRAGTLYYLHRPGESLKKMEAVAPVLAQVVRFEGRPDAGRFIERVEFRGVTFAHTEWCFPDGFDRAGDKPKIWPPPNSGVGGFAQAAVGVPGAVWGEGVRQCVFEDCVFTQLGNYGLELARGCQGNQVRRCRFEDLGAGGIKLGETQIREAAAERTGGNEVSQCEIHDGGKLFTSAIGIWLGQTPNNRLTHNQIHDFYYTGISIGWTWGYGPALASNNIVTFNHVHHLGAKVNGDGPVLSDMGGIYTLGRQPGTRIDNNLWHDIAGRRYGGWGIYFDEGSSGIVARSNVVYRTTHGGFHQHYGATNSVQNNIFAFARDHQVQRTRVEPHVSFAFQTNIIYFDSGVVLGGDWSGDRFEINRNVYFDARPGAKAEEMRFATGDFSQWRARGHDVDSIIADPLFVAPQSGDFRLLNDSPAFKLGFQPIDVTGVGPSGTGRRSK